MALCQRPDPPWTTRRRLPARRHLRPLPPHPRKPRRHGLRFRHPRHADHCSRRRRRPNTGRSCRRVPPVHPRHLGRDGHLLRHLHHDHDRQPPRRHSRSVQRAARTRLPVHQDPGPVLRPRSEALPPRPLHRGRMPALQRAPCSRRPVRHLWPPARRDRPDQSALSQHGRDARTPQLGTLLPPSDRVRGAAARVARRRQGFLAHSRPQLLKGHAARGPAGPRHHPRHRVGRPRPTRRLG